jgi:prepilin-type N-terminal cleavage/methylation domain-containing protein
MKNSKFTKGFTLIELLVVVAIIGILAAIVYAPLQTALRKGRDAKKVAEMKSIQSSLMMYADSNGGSYPIDLATLDTETVGGIPKNYNNTANIDLNKYNYTGYQVNGKVVGYHLYTHLETASPALDGAAKCRGAGSSTDSCVLYGSGGSTVTLTGVSPEPDSTQAYFLEAERTDDSDKNCAADLRSCIFDIRG